MFERLLTRWRTPVFSQEIALLQITAEEKVLHIGCGAFPSASLFIAQGRHAQIVGIDNNSIAVKLAQSYIRRKQLTSLITIEEGNGVSYPLAGFDVIFIAINVWPIDAVLSHCAHTMKPTARILVKGSHDDITTLLEKDEFRMVFSITATLKHTTSESFLLRKKT
jgi:precorrin-6B methylase 2